MANTFKNSFSQSVGQTSDTIYTATGVQATVIGMSVANVTQADVKALIEPGSALVPIGGDQKLVLESGDLIKVQSDTSSSLDVILSVLEIS
jgi:hypothetical protein